MFGGGGRAPFLLDPLLLPYLFESSLSHEPSVRIEQALMVEGKQETTRQYGNRQAASVFPTKDILCDEDEIYSTSMFLP